MAVLAGLGSECEKGPSRPMKLPANAVIARKKITDYLLVRQNRSDKSSFLESDGFTVLNPDALVAELATLCDQGDAQQVDENKFGRYYEITGILRGPLGIGLRVKTIWMTEHLSGTTKFVTLIPIEVVRP